MADPKTHNTNCVTLKRNTLRRTASFDVLSVKIHAGVSAVSDWIIERTEKVASKHSHGSVANMRVYISHILREETP